MTTFQKAVKYLAIALAVILIVSIFSGILGTLGLFDFFTGENAVSDQMKTYSVSQNISSLRIEINAADFSVTDADSFSVESNLKNLSVEEKDGCLVISETKKNGLSYTDAELNLSIPKGYVFNKIDITTGAGILRAETLAADEIRFQLGAGAVSIQELNAGTKADIDGGAGEIVISNGTLHNLDLDMGVGELNMTAAVLGNSELDYGVGEANLVLLGIKDDYRIEFDKGIGTARIDGENAKDDTVYGSGSNRIDIDGGVGTIRISFQENQE